MSALALGIEIVVLNLNKCHIDAVGKIFSETGRQDRRAPRRQATALPGLLQFEVGFRVGLSVAKTQLGLR